MSASIKFHDLFWFAVFHVGAIAVVALFSGCAGGPLGGGSLFSKQPVETPAEMNARLQQELGQARMHQQSDRTEKAMEIYHRLIVDFPQKAEPYHRLAVAQDGEKLHSEAQRHYLIALRLDPQNAQIHNDLGYSFFLSGNLTAAKAAMEQAVMLDPANKLFRNNLGMAVGHMGEYQAALDHFIAASGEDDAYYNLAFIYSTKQQFEEAKVCFRRALQVNPQHGRAAQALTSFERFEQNPEAGYDEMLASSDGGGYWQAYKEGGEVAQASFNEGGTHSSTAAADGSRALSEVSATRQQLHARASALLERRRAGVSQGNNGSQAGTTQQYNGGP